MKNQKTESTRLVDTKISQIGHQFKLVTTTKNAKMEITETKADKFSSAMELVRHLNKYAIKPQNIDIIPPFYRAMIK